MERLQQIRWDNRFPSLPRARVVRRRRSRSVGEVRFERGLTGSTSKDLQAAHLPNYLVDGANSPTTVMGYRDDVDDGLGRYYGEHPMTRSQSHQQISSSTQQQQQQQQRRQRRREERISSRYGASDLDLTSRRPHPARLDATQGIPSMGFFAQGNGTLGHRGIPSLGERDYLSSRVPVGVALRTEQRQDPERTEAKRIMSGDMTTRQDHVNSGRSNHGFRDDDDNGFSSPDVRSGRTADVRSGRAMDVREAEIRAADVAVILKSDSIEKMALPSVVVERQVKSEDWNPTQDGRNESRVDGSWKPETKQVNFDLERPRPSRPRPTQAVAPRRRPACCSAAADDEEEEQYLASLSNGKRISIVSLAVADPRVVVVTQEDLDRYWLPVFEKFVGATGFCYQRCLPSSQIIEPALPFIVLHEYLMSNERSQTRKGWCHIPCRLPDAARQELLRLTANADKDDWISYQQFLSVILQDNRNVRPFATNQSGFSHLLQDSVDAVIPKWYHQYYADCNPPPLFLPILTLLQIILFIYYTSSLGNGGASTPVPYNSPLIYDPHRRYEIWRYVTYVLLHAGYIHFIINIVFQLIVGLPLEVVHKWWRIAIIYLMGALGGSLAHSITDFDTFLVGASGGCYALMVAHLANVLLNFNEMRFGVVRIVVVVVVALIDTGYAIYERYALEEAAAAGGSHTVSFAAHIGGGFSGLFVGLLVLRNLRHLPWERSVWLFGVVFYVAFVVFAVLFNGFYDGYPDSDWIHGSYPAS